MTRSNATLLAGLLALSPAVKALPEGGNVQSGQVNTQVMPGMMNLQQLTDRAIINWNSFSIGSNELLRVLQPNQAAILLNRVVGQDPSVILGQLQANGNIWLLNPNGILFGPGSRVDVGGLLATTLNISDNDFLAGRYNFTQLDNKPLAAVINQGELTVSPQGYVILAAPLVSNEGMIVANLGKVGLVSGESMSLSFDSQGLISYRLTAAQAPAPGPVLMTPDQVSDVMRSVVQTGGVHEGNLITQQDGRILLTNGSGTTLNTGQVVAPGASVTLDSTTQTVLRNGSLISVNGTDYHPDAGDIRVLSQGATWAQSGSRLEASSNHGNGGFVEVSGNAIAVASQVDVAGATPAQSGDFLIDPSILNVTSTPGDLDGNNPIGPSNNPGGSSTVSVGYLQSINSGTVHLEADQDLFVDSSFSLQNGVGLNLTATSGNVTFNSPLVQAETTNAPINITAGDSITLGAARANGDTVTLTAPNSITGSVQNSTVVVNAGTTGAVNLDAGSVNQFTAQAGGVNLTNNDNLTVSVNATNDFQYNGVGDIVGAVNATTLNVSTGNFIGLNTTVSNITGLVGNNAFLNNTGAVGVRNLGLANTVELNNTGDLTFVGPGSRIVGNNATVNVNGNLFLNPTETSLTAGNTVVLNATGNIDYDGQPGIVVDASATNVAIAAGGSSVPVSYDLNTTANIAIHVGSGDINLESNGSLNVTTIAGISGAQTGSGNINGYLGSGGAVLTLDAPVNTTNGDVDLLSFGDITVNANVTASGDVILFADTISLAAPVAANYVEMIANFGGVGIVQVGSGVRIQADTALLSAFGDIGSLAAPLITDVSVLAASAFGTGNNYISDGVDTNLRPHLDLAPIPTGEGDALGVRGSNNVSLNVVGNLTARDVRGLNTTINATGDIFIDTMGSSPAGISGPKDSYVNITTGGNLTGNGLSIPTPDIAVDTDVNVTAAGTVNVSTSSQNLNVQAVGNVNIDHFTDANVTGVNSTTGSVDLYADGNLILLGNSQAAADFALEGFDVTMSGANITAGNTAVVLANGDGGILSTTNGGAIDVSAANVALGGGEIQNITVSANNLAADATGNLSISTVGSVNVTDLGVMAGISSSFGDSVQLTSPGNINVDADVAAGSSNVSLNAGGALTLGANVVGFTNVSLTAGSGDLTVNSGFVNSLLDIELLAVDGNVRLNSPGVVSAPYVYVTANATTPGNGNIIGTGAGPQIVAGTNLTAQDSISGLILNAQDSPPVFLDVTAGNSAQISSQVNTILSSASVGTDLQLDVTGNLDLTSPITAGGTAGLNVTGNLTENYGGPGNLITANALGMRIGGAYIPNTAALAVNVTQLALLTNNPGQLDITTDVTPVTVTAVNGVTGITVPNGLNLTTQGSLTVDAPITAGNVGTNNITVQNGNLALNAPVGAGNEVVRIQVPAGNISMNGLSVDASDAQVSAAGNIIGSGAAPNARAGTLTLAAPGGSINVSVADDAGGSIIALVSALNDVSISSQTDLRTDTAVATNGNLDLNVNGNFILDGNSLVGGSRVSVNATGDVAHQSAAAFAQTPSLGINAATVSGNPLVTNVTTLAIRTAGDDVVVSNSSPDLTVGNVNGITGLSGNNINLSTSGNLTVTDSIFGGGAVSLTAPGNLSVANPIGANGALSVAAGGDLSITSAGNLISDLQVVLSGNNVTGAGGLHRDVVAPAVAVSGNDISNLLLYHGAGSTNTTLAAASNGSLGITVEDFAVVGTVNGLDGVTAADNVSLGTTYASLTVNRPITADNVSLAASGVNVVSNVAANSTLTVTSILSVDLASGALSAPDVNILATDNINGLGGNEIVSNNVGLTTNTGNVTGIDIDATGPANLSLDVATNATVNVDDSLTLAPGSQVGRDLQLGVNGNLTLNGTLSAGNSAALAVTGSLITSGTPGFVMPTLSLDVGDMSAPVNTDVSQLSGRSGGSFAVNQSSTPLTVGAAGINATGPVNLTTQGALTVNGAVNGSTVNASVGSGDLSLNAPLQSPGAVNVQVSAGNAVLSSNSIQGPNAAVNASDNISGVGAAPHIVSGNVSLNATNINAVGLARANPGTIALDFNAANAASISAANSVALNGASTVGTDLELAVNGNLTLSNNVVAGNNISVNVTGDLANSGVVPSFQGNALSLRAGNLTGAPVTTNVSFLAAQSSGDLSIDQSGVATPLTISAVNGVTGVNATGTVNLNTQGTLTVAAPVRGTDVNLGVSAGDLNTAGFIQGSNSATANVNGAANLGLGFASPNVALNASNGITGVGRVNHILSNNVTLDSGSANITNVTLAAGSPGPIDLDFNAGVATISAVNSVDLGTATANDMRLDVIGNLSLSNSIVAGGTVVLNTTGNLANAGGVPSIQANALGIRAEDIVGAPLTTNVSLLAAETNNNLTVDQVTATPLQITAVNGIVGINAPNVVNITTAGPLSVTSQVTGVNVSVNSAGNMSLSDVVVGIVNTTVGSGGDISMTGLAVAGDRVTLSAGGNITGTGGFSQVLTDNLVATAPGGALNFTTFTFSEASTNVTLNARDGINATFQDDVQLFAANSSLSDVNLNVSGNLTRQGALTAANQVGVNVTGTVFNTAPGLFAQANGLVLRTGGVSGLPLATNVSTLAAQAGGNLSLDNTGPNLTTVAVAGVNGVNATNVNLTSSGGNLTVTAPVTATGNATVNATGDLGVTQVSAGNAVDLRAGGNLIGLGLGPHASGASVNLTGANVSSLSVNTPVLNGSATNDASVNALGDVNAGFSAGNNLDLSATAALTIASPTSAANLSLSGASVNVSTPVSGSSLNVTSTAGAIDLHDQALSGATVTVNATGNLNGLGTAPNIQAANVNLSSQTGSINTLTVAPSSPVVPINLAVNAAQAAQVSSGGSLNLNGASGVGTDLELATTGNLTLNTNLVAGGTVALNVTGDLANPAGTPSVQATALALRVGNVTGSPVTLDVSQLAAQSGGDLNLAQVTATPLTVTAVNGVNGLTSPGVVNLTTQGPLTVNSGISGSDVNLGVASGNLDFNALVQGSNSVSAQVNAGDVNLNGVAIQAPNAAVNASGNLNGLGIGPQVVSNNVSLNGNDLNSLSLAALAPSPINLAFNASTGAQISAANSVNLSGASSVGTDLELATDGNLTLNNNLVAGGTVALNVTGDLANPAGTPSVQANALALRVGNVTGTPVTLNVTQLAAQSGGDLNLAQVTATPLTVTAVNGVTGLSSPAAVNLTTQGPLNVDAGVNGADVNLNVGSGDLNVNAPVVGTSSANLQVTNGNANLSGNAVAAPSAAVNASGNLTGGTVQANTLTAGSTGGAVNITAAALTAGQINLNGAAQTDLNVVALNNVSLTAATAATGDVNLQVNGDLTRAGGPIVAGNQVALNVTGNLDNAVAGPFAQGNSLVIRAADVTGLPLATNVTTLAAQSSGSFSLNNSDSLVISNLSGVNGVNATDLTVNVNGNLTVASPLSASNNAAANASNNLTVTGGGVVAGNQSLLTAGGTLSGVGVGPHAVANAVGLSGNEIGPFTVNAGLIAANSNNNVSLTGLGNLAVGTVGPRSGLTGTGTVALTTPGNLSVNAGVSGANVNLTGAGLTVTGPVSATTANLTAAAGEVVLNGTAVNAANAGINATGNISGLGVGPQITSNNVSLNSQTGSLRALQLGPAAPGNIALDFNAAQGAQLSSNGSVNLNATSSVGTDLEMAVNGNLTLNSNLTAGGTIALNVTNHLANSAASPSFQANALSLRTNTMGPITTNVSQLAAVSNSQLNIQQSATPLTITAVNGVTGLAGPSLILDTQGPLTVNSPIVAPNTNLVVRGGDLNLNAAVQANVGTVVEVHNGGLNLQGQALQSPVTSVNISGNLSGGGLGPNIFANSLNVNSDTGSANFSVGSFDQPQIALNVGTAGNTSVTATNSLVLNGLRGSAGDVNLNVSGDISKVGTVQAGGTATLNATGNLDNTSANPFIANSLVLQASGVTGQPLATNVSNLSAQSGGALSINQDNTPLTVSGVTASGALQLNTQNALTINGPVSASSVALDVANGNLDINALVSGATSVLAQVDNGAVNLNNLAISTQNAGVNATGDITGIGFGPHVVAGNISLSSQNGSLSSLRVGSPNASPINLALNAAGNADVTAINGIVLTPPTVGGTLGLSVQGDLTLSAPLTASSVALAVSGDLNGTLAVGQLQLTTGGSVGSSANPLQLNGPTTIAGNVAQNAFIQSDSTLTVGTVNGTNGLSGAALDLTVSSGNLSLQQGLTATGGVNVSTPAGSITGPGVITADTAVLAAQGEINVNTSVNGLAAVSGTHNVTINETNGLTVIGVSVPGVTPMAAGNVIGIQGNFVNVTLLAGDLNVADPSLGNNSAIVGTQQVDIKLLSGNVVGSAAPATKADITAPFVNFAVNGSIGSPLAPIRVGPSDVVTASNPNFFGRFPAPPEPPTPPQPPILIEEPGEPPTVVVFVDSTSIGLTVGTSIPVLLLQPAENNDNPANGNGLWQVQLAWVPSGSVTPMEPQPFQRTYLLDLSLEQLMRQPLTSGYIQMSLEQLLNEPVLSPFLEKELEELLNIDIDIDTGDAKQD